MENPVADSEKDAATFRQETPVRYLHAKIIR